MEQPLNSFQAEAAKIALQKLLHGKHFSICDFDKIAKLLGVQVGGKDYEALNALHCIEYATMSPSLRQGVEEKVFELLGLHNYYEAAASKENSQAQEPSPPRLKLAFWHKSSSK